MRNDLQERQHMFYCLLNGMKGVSLTGLHSSPCSNLPSKAPIVHRKQQSSNLQEVCLVSHSLAKGGMERRTLKNCLDSILLCHSQSCVKYIFLLSLLGAVHSALKTFFGQITPRLVEHNLWPQSTRPVLTGCSNLMQVATAHPATVNTHTYTLRLG